MTGYYELAKGLLIAHRNVSAAETAPARKVAVAHLDGMCDAAHRLGLGMTPTAVRVAVAEVLRSAGTRPAPNLSSRAGVEPTRAWDAVTAGALDDVLRQL